jgi:anti-sigma factor RsiW
MTSPAESEETDLQLSAYLDGELDAIAAKRFEERMANEPDLAATFAKLMSLRASLRADLAADVPSEALRRRIANELAAPRRWRLESWRALAASLIVGAFIGGGAMLGVLQNHGGSSIGDQMVSAHIRAMMAPQPIDVASSDRHTVKPWFDGKIAFAPEVVDLAQVGFPLVGGRIDIVDLEPVPTLVYRAGRHLISVAEIPEDQGAAAPVVRNHDRGFETARWSDGRATYFAVTDASADEMTAFVAALRAAPP